MRYAIGCALLAHLLVTACASSSEHEPATEQTGKVVVPLVTEHAGTTYRLRASFELSGRGEPIVFSTDEAEDAAYLERTFPSGQYVLTLLEGWQLERSTPSGYEPVAATLVESPQVRVRLTGYAETQVVFSFELDERIIDFSRGTLRIGIDVQPRTLGAAQLSLGMLHTCATLDNGALRCWGQNSLGQLGYPASDNIGDDETPAEVGNVPLEAPVRQVVAGSVHSCALLDSGAVRCWGYAQQGQLGYGDTPVDAPLIVPPRSDDVPVGDAVEQLAAGDYHVCALLTSGAVRCWGDNSRGQLGYGHTETLGDDETPEDAGDVPLGAEVHAIAAGAFHTCALLRDGGVRCWGSATAAANAEDVGDDETPDSIGNVALGLAATQLAAGGAHTCAILTDGALRCWGRADEGQLGYGNTETIGDDEAPSAAGDVPVGGPVMQVAAGAQHTCAVLTSQQLLCWGRGAQGRLGYGNTESVGDDETPASVGAVPTSTPWVSGIALGAAHSCALIYAGDYQPPDIQCWGAGTDGQLGYGRRETIGDDEPASAAGSVPLTES